MAQCSNCGKKGLFLRVDQFCLCPDCSWNRKVALYNLSQRGSERNSSCPRNITWPVIGSMITNSTNNALRILADSSKLIENTANPDTFYSRRTLIFEQLNYLVKVERVDPSLFRDVIPTSLLPRIESEIYKSETAMWRRKFDSVMEKAVNYKTEKGKTNAVNRFFDDTAKYEFQMSEAAKKQIASLRKRFDIKL